MFQTFLCVGHQHNPWLVLMAAVVSLMASLTTLWMFMTGAERGEREGDWWRLYAGLVGSSGIWATHFICMLAFDPGVPASYDAVGAAISLLIALAFTTAAVFVADRMKGPLRLPAWAVLFVTGVGAMHYYGTLALHTAGVMSWDPAYVLASVAAGLGLSALSMRVLGGRGEGRRFVLASLSLTLSVCTLHFLGMAGLRIAPDPRILAPLGTVPRTTIALWVGGLTLAILLAAACTMTFAARARTSALKLLNGAFEATPNGLAYFDASDRLVFCNEAYQRGQAALGIKSEIGLTYADILSRAVQAGAILAPAGEEAEWMAGLLRARREASSVREQQAPDGRVFQISNNHTPDGGIVSSYTDITELRQQAQDLTVARDAAQAADRAKSVFLANMSHELRTPMNGVMGVAGLLAHEPLTMRQAELVSIIQASGSVLDRLLADLLDMSSLEAGAIKIESAPFQLGATVNQVCALLAPQSEDKGLPLRVEIDAGADLRFLGDEARVKQILTNLVSNAIKFTDRGEVLVSAAASAGEVTLSVIDTGIGFDPADKARLFARFEQADGSSTRRYGGSGLGLSVSQDLALHMGGRVTAENRPEGGSVFALTLPLPLAPDVETSGQADEVEAPEGGARALVVDDNSTNQRVLSLILKGAGIDCVLADDGSQAVELWRSEGFDLVFMDIQMPVMDGVTAVRTIRALEAETGRPKTPIIMVSANAQPDDVHESHAAGADAHVAKPVSAGHLFEVINRVVNDIGEQDQVAA